MEKSSQSYFLFGLRWLGKSLRFTPLSLLMVIIMWGLREVLGAENPTNTLGLSLPWTIISPHFLTAGLSSSPTTAALMSTLWIIVFAVPAERILGSLKFAVAAVLLHISSVPLGIGIAYLIEEAGLNRWGNNLLEDVLLTPDFWVFGVAAFASASMPLLWRRRTRLVLFTITLTLLLYTGTLADVTVLTATIIGTVVGELGRHRKTPGRRWFSGSLTIREARIMSAILITAVAVGPVLAALNPLTHGPFSSATELIWQPLVTEEHMHHLCHADGTSDACQGALDQLQQHGVGPSVANLIPLILTVVLALGLSRGRRVAWMLSVLAQLLSIAVLMFQLIKLSADATDLLWSVNAFSVIVPWLIALAVLVIFRRAFQVKIDTARISQSAIVLSLTLLGTAAIWILTTLLIPHAFHPHPTIGLALKELPFRYLPPTIDTVLNHQLFPRSPRGWAVFEWTGTLFWLVAAAVLYHLLMGVHVDKAYKDQEKAAETLKAGSGDHLSWMTTWGGNTYWWAPKSTGYVAYRVKRGVAITLGEPIIGPDSCESKDDLARQFEEFASHQGWIVAWYSVGEQFSTERMSAGHHKLRVAEEAVLHPEQADFKGKRFQNVRTARNRAAKESVHAIWTTWAKLSTEMQHKIISLSEEWVSEKALPEMGFTLGTVNELSDPDTFLLLAVGADDHLHGITSWLPVFEDGYIVGYTLDVMRRDPQGFKSVIEFLISEAVVIARDLNLKWVSLSGAPLSSTNSMDNRGTIDAILDLLGKAMEPF
ncbi:lysyl-tRNA synthetase [Corynebacterium suranareeae]|uniref:Lysyl-tRNA synthetase n=1 Tax=Corynebacterium suranareeae TaxID=2506452 RepID=A0A160PNE1_9CORY|nr:phosphatidylglycerol lysyltransferase domain-containing protein [Corynebacterium suranareeae]BAU95349.1 lysyl-tRNA synthetase [Corynebacterium suranareeae]